ncbi:hypothetical protein PHLCEN_2v9563 [Hermanssonia centrifuga]|uniref:Uncharacterized protein n=1 Tax=Hermanssonia centrifuga TaxID=98765 RepID=A0A2R6NQF5_9APHY|nr:hypothetical protein PHLCEN_2v9563 [Hermanssonia centrifuga]
MHSVNYLSLVPNTVLENIAFWCIDPLGPPAALIPLLLICKDIYLKLLPPGLSHASGERPDQYFYARIFKFLFDSGAIDRRLGPRPAYSRNLAAQLLVYCPALKRIRSGNIHADTVQDDLWSAYFMMMENDGRNAAQLLEWAGLKAFVDRFVRTRLLDGATNGWPCENIINSLAVWLLYATTDEATIISETPEKRGELMDLLRPYVTMPIRYPSFYAPDNHFEFPISRDFLERLPVTIRTPNGAYPVYRSPLDSLARPMHYREPFYVRAPLISVSAKLLYFSRAEAVPQEVVEGTPLDRADAIARGITYILPTRVDYAEFNSHKAVKFLNNGSWERNQPISMHLDIDWDRSLYCFDPWSDGPLNLPYTFGTLTGLWLGRINFPDMRYFSRVMSRDYDALQQPMTYLPLAMYLREHHSINPRQRIPPGGDPKKEMDDGVNNGWLPHGKMRLDRRGLSLYDQQADVMYQCEHYVRGRPSSHNVDTCTNCIAKREREEARYAAQQEDVDAMDTDDDSEGVEYSERSQRSRRLGGTFPDDESFDGEMQRGENIRMQINAGLPDDTDIDEVLDAEMASTEDSSEYLSDDGSVSDESDDGEEVECNGVQDVIITGETLPRHGDAWHHFVFYGRVRKFDGLIALVRRPISEPTRGVQIFRGYVIGGKTWIGNWRALTADINSLPLEGPFVASRFETPARTTT